jgi:hypothetical protein
MPPQRLPDYKPGITHVLSPAPVTVELFGHVTLVESYVLTDFTGCYALIALRDTPGKTVAVLTSQHRLQTLLETALSTGNLMSFLGRKSTNPPTPRGGLEVYNMDGLTLYSMK